MLTSRVDTSEVQATHGSCIKLETLTVAPLKRYVTPTKFYLPHSIKVCLAINATARKVIIMRELFKQDCWTYVLTFLNCPRYIYLQIA